MHDFLLILAYTSSSICLIVIMSTKLVKKQLNGILTEVFKPLEEESGAYSAKKRSKSLAKVHKNKPLKNKRQFIPAKNVREANLSYFRSTKESSKATQALLKELLHGNAPK